MKLLFKFLSIFILLCSAQTVMADNEKPVWIDVRTPAEYQQGHLQQANLIPYDEITEKISVLNLKKDQPIYLYCRSGHRAGIAQNTLNNLGYKNVINMGAFQELAKQYPSTDANK